jgi:glycosyltransferase involved in cell wall biosynthesis
MRPRISIITVTYNSAATVAQTLQCIKGQDYPEIEHIVIDGLSGDGTLDIVRDFPHVAKVISEKDQGIYDAMNKGIALATGEVIGILNSDDIYADDRVLSSVAAIFEDEKVDACYADLQYVEQHDLSKVIRTWKTGGYSREAFYWGWMPPHPTFFVRRKVYDQVGLFNTLLKSSADYEMILRIMMKHKIKACYIPRVIVKMRAGGMSNATFWNRLRANKEDRLAWKLNGLHPYFFTLYMKPLRKLPQFIIR